MPKLLGTVDRSVDLSQERFHSEYYDPLELRMHCATILSTLVLTPLFFYIAVVLNKGVSFSILRRRACISLCTGTISAHIILILFGAPLLTASFKTLGLSIMFGAVSLMPLGCTIGSDIRVWRRVISYNDLQEAGEIQFYVPVALAAGGAWLGAFPIPLDWDRPWQVWMRVQVLKTILAHAQPHPPETHKQSMHGSPCLPLTLQPVLVV